MVRNIVGALVGIGRDRFPPIRLDAVLASRERDPESQTAPARGLCLMSVEYPKHLFVEDESPTV
jgi:tRNA pseudouridine38-40 synthase